MPVFDWTRTQLDKELFDGSNALVYYKDQLEKMDPLTGELALPGWDSSYKKEDLKNLFDEYKNVTEEDMFDNLKYFLDAIMPVAIESDVKMAIHPDDPAWPVFNLPRIITGKEKIQRLLDAVPDKENGLTLCTGSLGSNPKNDIPDMIRSFKGRIHFGHVRNVIHLAPGKFDEAPHPSCLGSLDMYEIMKALYDIGFDGPMRPDHGRTIWGEKCMPGYGLYDRALGAAYLNGLWEAIGKSCK